MLIGDPLVLGLLLGVILTIGAWALAARGGRLTGMPIWRGFRNGLAAAAAIGAIVAVLIAIAMNGREFLFSGTLNLREAFALGLLVGIPVAIGFFWIGALLMPIGLLIRPSATWSTAGTWLAVPIAAAGFYALYAGYQGVKAQIEAPAIATGTVTFDINGRSIGHATGHGQANCTTFDSGTFRVDAGTLPTDITLMTDDGRDASIQFVWAPADSYESIYVTIGDFGADSGWGSIARLSLSEGSTDLAGSIVFSGVPPLGADDEPDLSDPWSGRVSWDCASR